ncbi:hypothetical protein RY831_21215 [Noviherbaspirillum sp. CPCC 100848]|uniref:Secreted protein n=1 Tax=Noviherbaspirillum album TaxID=3080276 RepID=A0ABU6JEQ2_9BURK|nr:hypothetical protein [Noviherbaspirillum sp. CPCC 100848]MEC4721692.1 hypothetical protein [Noviherbaspirillum sp. CPCC 100848]
MKRSHRLILLFMAFVRSPWNVAQDALASSLLQPAQATTELQQRQSLRDLTKVPSTRMEVDLAWTCVA